MTRVLGLSTSDRLIRPAPERPTILLFDQDGHPAVPTCARPRCRAQRRSRMPVGHRRRRRVASWTAASTTAFSSQRRTTMRLLCRCPRLRSDQDAPFRRGFTPPLTHPVVNVTKQGSVKRWSIGTCGERLFPTLSRSPSPWRPAWIFVDIIVNKIRDETKKAESCAISMCCGGCRQ